MLIPTIYDVTWKSGPYYRIIEYEVFGNAARSARCLKMHGQYSLLLKFIHKKNKLFSGKNVE